MNEHRDIILSLRRAVALVLRAYDTDFDVRMAIEEDAWERPCAVVQTAGPTQVENQHYRLARSNRPFSIYVYPTQRANPKATELEAARLEAVLAAMFQRGGIGGLRPMRVPIFDWTGVEDNEPLDEDAGPVAFMKVESVAVDHKPDPDDETLVTVWANVRVSWRGLGEGYPDLVTLEKITLTGDGK